MDFFGGRIITRGRNIVTVDTSSLAREGLIMQLMLYTKYGAEFMVGCHRLAVFHICIRFWGYPQRYHT